MLPITVINARDIPDAWFQCLSKVQDVGFSYKIQQGSFVDETRKEFDWITVNIEHPYAEPYDLMLPEIPSHLNIPNPVAAGYIEQYLPYLMDSNKEDTESYTYGQRMTGYVLPHAIVNGMTMDKSNYFENLQFETWINDERLLSQVYRFIELLKKTPNTNQAILQVAQPMDCLLKDPPCLRHIDMRVKQELIEVASSDGFGYQKKNILIFYPYFRSWDLWGGFPANLAAIAVLQKFMADEIGIESGPIIASSKGLHIYGYVEELAKIRCNKE